MEIILKNTSTGPMLPNSWSEYTDQSTGNTIKFRAGEQPWTWEIETTCPVLKKNKNKILNRYVEQGMKQHDYKGGFAEAVSILKIKA